MASKHEYLALHCELVTTMLVAGLKHYSYKARTPLMKARVEILRATKDQRIIAKVNKLCDLLVALRIAGAEPEHENGMYEIVL